MFEEILLLISLLLFILNISSQTALVRKYLKTKTTKTGNAFGLTISTGSQIINQGEASAPSAPACEENVVGQEPPPPLPAVSGMGDMLKNLTSDPAELLTEIGNLAGFAFGRNLVSQVPVRIVQGQTFGASLDRTDQVTALNDFEALRAVGDISLFNSDTDELDSAFYTRRFFYVRTLNVSNAPETLSDIIVIAPCQTTTQITQNVPPTPLVMTPFEWFCRLFSFWRGGIEISLQYIAPRDVSMRFWVCIGYGKSWDQAPAYSDALQMPGVFCEFDANNRQQNIEIPYVCPDLWAVPEGQWLNTDGSTYQADFANLGTVFIYTTASPNGPQVVLGTTPATQLNLWIRGADDFDVRVFQPQPMLNYANYVWPVLPPPPRTNAATPKVAPTKKSLIGNAHMMAGEKVGTNEQPPQPVIKADTSDKTLNSSAENSELIADAQNVEVRRPTTQPVRSGAGTRSSVVAPLDLVNLNQRAILVKSWKLDPQTPIGIVDAFIVPEDFRIPALRYMMQAAQYWRGNLNIRMHVISTGFNGGMLALAYVPGLYVNSSTVPTDFENPVRLLSLKNMVTLDVSSNQACELLVPYQAQTDWINTDSEQTPAAWGTVIVYLLNSIQAGAATSGSQSVTLQMHVQWSDLEAVIRRPISTSMPTFPSKNNRTSTVDEEDSVVMIDDMVGPAHMDKSDPIARSTTQTAPYTAHERDTRYSVTPVVVTKQKPKSFKLNQFFSRPCLISSGTAQVVKGSPVMMDLPQPCELDPHVSGGGFFTLLRPLFAAYRGDVEFIINLKTKDATQVSVCVSKVNSYNHLENPSITPLLPTPLQYQETPDEEWAVPLRLSSFSSNYTVPMCIPTVLTNLPSTLHVLVPFYSCKRFTTTGNQTYEKDCFTSTNQSRAVLAMWAPADSTDTIPVEYQIFMVIPETASFGLFQGIPPVYPDCEVAYVKSSGAYIPKNPLVVYNYPGVSVVNGASATKKNLNPRNKHT